MDLSQMKRTNKIKQRLKETGMKERELKKQERKGFVERNKKKGKE
jgi:hypothetical protein